MKFIKRKYLVLALILSMVGFTLVGCSSGGDENNTTIIETGSVEGYVQLDEIATSNTNEEKVVVSKNNLKSLVGVEGANILIDDKTTETDENGFFSLVGIKPGVHNLIITHDSFLNMKIEKLEIKKNETKKIERANFPRLFRIFIGINDYPYADNLFYAVKDAKDYYSTLVESSELNSYYYNAYGKVISDKNATKQNIKDAIIETGEIMQPEDHLIITFSGHGGPLENTDGYDEEYGSTVSDEFIAVYDDIILDDELELWVSNNINSSNILFIFDSCYSEGMYRSYNPKVTSKDLYGHGYAVITASNDNQLSFDGNIENQNGLFTNFFLEGIQTRQADTNQDGDITASEAFNYAEPKVVKFSKEKPKMTTQNPQIFLEEGYDPIVYRYKVE